MLSRVMEGGKNSLLIGFFASSLSIFISLKIGVWAGYYRGIADKAITAFIDLFLTIPTFFLLLSLVAYVDITPIFLIFIIAISSWMGTARRQVS